MMFSIIRFELSYWKKRAVTYVFPLIVFVVSLLLFTVENVSFGSDVVYRNSPHSLFAIYFLFSLLLPLFVNSFVSSSVTRDYENKFHQIIYSLPVSKTHILLSRFVGGCLVISALFFGIVAADLVSNLVPWANQDLLGPFRWDAHFQNFFLIAIPNIIIVGSILFLVSSWTKNINYSFLGAIVIVVCYLTFSNLNDKIDNKIIASLSDPYGCIPIEYYTKKWSAFEKNNFLFQTDWKYWVNRIIWLTISLFLWVIALKKDRISAGFGEKKMKNRAIKDSPYVSKGAFSIQMNFSSKYIWRNLHYQALIDFKHIVKSLPFFVIVGLILMMLVMNFVGMIQDDSINSLATTNNTLNFLGVINTMMNLGIIYFAGMLIWKERDNKMQDIFDVLPNRTWVIYVGKLLSVVYLSIVINIVLLVLGIFYQLVNGIYTIDWGHYIAELFGINLVNAITLTILSMFFQIIINNKFIAYFVSCILMVAEPFILEWIDISSNLFGISPKFPSIIFSDFYGYGFFKTSYLAFIAYWLLIYAILAYISYLMYVRGYVTTIKDRLTDGKKRFTESRFVLFLLLGIAIPYAGFMYYQTKVVNHYFSTKEVLERKSYYEKNFKRISVYPIPKVIDVDYKINLYPHDRKYDVHCKIKLVNNETRPIDTIFINNRLDFPYQISMTNAVLIDSDKYSTVNFQTYKLSKPLKVGDSMIMEYDYREFYRGVENEISNNRLQPNGTFMDLSSFTPMIGYQDDLEIEDKSDREKYGLSVKAENMPALEKNCGHKCMKDYLGGGSLWAKIHTVISTSGDQIAIAPGKMVKQWKESGRNYFEYDLAQPSKFFFSIVSGKYQVLRDTENGVNCEVYYIPEHKYNVAEMMKSLKRSIAYYSKHFGEYKHHDARIIEFPEFSSFAQAFPGTMPYSENIGFTSNLVKNPKDVNEIFHVVCHEMAHQWWAHQVIGAMMQGATLMSESLAEYSSLKLLEREYGLDMTAKFLKQSNNGYIFSRAQEVKKESALYQVDNQPYIHYQKGSVVLYGIQQLLGEEKMNQALKNFNTKYAYKAPPYPTSHALLEEIYAVTPDSFMETVKDGLERIIIFKSDISAAKTVQLPNKKFETTIDFSLTKNSSDPNAKQTQKIKDIIIGQSKEAPINDYFDIGLFKNADDKSRYGKSIIIKRFKLNQKKNRVKIWSDIRPDKIVIDPYFIHIHRDPEDNIEKI